MSKNPDPPYTGRALRRTRLRNRALPSVHVWALALCMLIALLVALAPAHAEVASGGNFRVSFEGRVSPRLLPRSNPVPVSLRLQGRIRPLGSGRPPVLRRLTIAVNRHALLSVRGLPVCRRRLLVDVTTARALTRCHRSLLGTGFFRAHVRIPEQSPFPSDGRLLVFSSRLRGHPALLGQVYGTEPLPISRTLPIALRHDGSGNFRAVLAVKMPVVGDDWGYVSGFGLTLHRRYRYLGRPRSFLSASCPAPMGLVQVPFEAARGTFHLGDGRVVTRTLSSSCRGAASSSG